MLAQYARYAHRYARKHIQATIIKQIYAQAHKYIDTITHPTHSILMAAVGDSSMASFLSSNGKFEQAITFHLFSIHFYVENTSLTK